MKKTPNQKLALTTQTIRHLQHHDLAQVVGGSMTSGTSIRQTLTSGTSISAGTTVISIGSGTSISVSH